MKEQDLQIRVIRFLSGEMTADERQQLLESVSKSAEKQKFFEEYQEIWEKTEIEANVPEIDISSQWQRFERQAFQDEGQGKVLPLWSRPLFKVAAMVAILVSSILAWSILTTDTVIDSGQMVVLETSLNVEQFILPDGSTLWLNKDSRIEYASDFQPREIHLKGEALFEVQHLASDESFSVHTKETKVTVLGTVFMVKEATASNAETVFVQEGKVAFENLSGKKEVEILNAGEQAVYNTTSQTVTKLDQPQANLLSWKTGSFSFDDTPLAEILPVLEQHYGVIFKIVNPDLLDCTYNSEFSNMNLNEMLEELSFGLNLDIRQRQSGLYEVDGIPCK